jgi:hypothetical protein
MAKMAKWGRAAVRGGVVIVAAKAELSSPRLKQNNELEKNQKSKKK